MPFRALYRRLGVKHVEAYNLITLAAGAIACMVITVAVTFSLIQQNEREQDLRAAEAAERQRFVVCMTIDRMVAVYREADTEVGKNAYNAWKQLAGIFRCKLKG
jgi:hypothetical protein